MSAFISWLKGLFAPENRKTTMAGIVALAGTAASCAGMASGAPITPGTVGMGLTGLATGVGLLAAKDASGKITPPALAEVVKDVSDLGTTATNIDPLYQPLKESIEAAGKQASDAAKVVAVAQAIQTISQSVPPAS